MIDILHDRLFGEPQAPQPLEQYRQGNLQFQSGERGSNAEVDSSAKRQVHPVIAIRFENQWIRELDGVKIGGGKD